MSGPRVSVVIVTWNGWSLTERTLRSLLADAGELPLEIIVADNGSTDGTIEALAREFPMVRTLTFESNLGFAVANNRAVEVVRSPLVFLLNNDTIVQPGTMAALVGAADRHPEFSTFATQMIKLHAPSRVDNRGIYVDATAHCRQLESGAPVEPGRAEGEVFGPSGGAALIRAEVIASIGLFDASLGSYWEDCDFACRARAAGYRCLYVPAARILHEGSATGNRLPERKLAQIQRNMAIVCARWFPFHPLRWWSWLSVAREGYYVLRGALAGHGRLVVRAKLEGRKWRDRPARGSAEALTSWIGVRARP